MSQHHHHLPSLFECFATYYDFLHLSAHHQTFFYVMDDNSDVGQATCHSKLKLFKSLSTLRATLNFFIFKMTKLILGFLCLKFFFFSALFSFEAATLHACAWNRSWKKNKSFKFLKLPSTKRTQVDFLVLLKLVLRFLLQNGFTVRTQSFLCKF